jgi:hypothetical protein
MTIRRFNALRARSPHLEHRARDWQKGVIVMMAEGLAGTNDEP